MFSRSVRFATVVAVATVVLFGVTNARAATLGFFNISDNSGVAADVASQLRVAVSEPSSGQVAFTFFNDVGIASSLTDIYFDDDVPLLQSIVDIKGSSGVSFSEGAAPGNLPGGKPYGFDANFSLDSNTPVPQSGVNAATESVGVVFSLLESLDVSNVIAALLPGGGLRIGVRVQAINGEASESFLVNPIPLPPSLILFLSGLVGIAVLGRKAKRRAIAA